MVRLMAVGCLCCWLSLINYAQLLGKGVGVYLIMVTRMLFKDVLKFLFLIATIVPGFAITLTFLERWKRIFYLNTEQQSTDAVNMHVQHELFQSNPYGPTFLFFSTIEGGEYNLSDENDTLTSVLMSGFLVLGPVLTLVSSQHVSIVPICDSCT